MVRQVRTAGPVFARRTAPFIERAIQAALRQVELEFPALETQSALPNAKLSYVAPRPVSQIADQAK